MLMEDALRFLFTQQRLLLADNVSLVTHSCTGVIAQLMKGNTGKPLIMNFRISRCPPSLPECFPARFN